MNVAMLKPQFSLGMPSLMAFVVVFLLGAASGYIAEGFVRPTAAAQPVPAAAPATPCPAGTHVVVWYTARTWECVSDVSG